MCSAKYGACLRALAGHSTVLDPTAGLKVVLFSTSALFMSRIACSRTYVHFTTFDVATAGFAETRKHHDVALELDLLHAVQMGMQLHVAAGETLLTAGVPFRAPCGEDVVGVPPSCLKAAFDLPSQRDITAAVAAEHIERGLSSSFPPGPPAPVSSASPVRAEPSLTRPKERDAAAASPEAGADDPPCAVPRAASAELGPNSPEYDPFSSPPAPSTRDADSAPGAAEEPEPHTGTTLPSPDAPAGAGEEAERHFRLRRQATRRALSPPLRTMELQRVCPP
ncbi:unnamed protein product [Effrenium voratum]|uniref:Uncharacterized protein n=1 Tax=Effrenium voratum TaxID=2562239 RepID=A0AA36IAB6_9DINO|nr:unnamed protein product [Effrenium voratum]